MNKGVFWIVFSCALFLSLVALGQSEVDNVAPHRPDPTGMSSEAYSEAKEAWIKKYPAEYDALVKQTQDAYESKVKLPSEKVTLIPDVGVSGITQLAAHFPKFKPMDDMDAAYASYQQAKLKWKQSYPEEFKNLVRFMSQAVGSDKLPRFMSYPVTDRQPLIIMSEHMDSELLTYELRMMNWTYTYSGKEVKSIYDVDLVLPANFSKEEYTTNMMLRIPDEYDRKMFFEEGMEQSQDATTNE